MYLERNIQTVDVADLSHALPESCLGAQGWVLESAEENSDNFHARLLRTGSGSEGHCAEHHDEVATPHLDPFAASAALRAFFAELYYQPAGRRRRSQAAFRLSNGRDGLSFTLGYVRLGS